MSLEIDHMFVLSDIQAPEADRLVDAGISEGTPNVHHGQGTRNRRFFFENFMLEFLWVDDPIAADSDRTAPTRLLPRWERRERDASPFGLCFRDSAANSSAPAPFKTWPYQPRFLPDDLSIAVAENVGILHEPFVFYIPWAKKPNPAQQPVAHMTGFRALTAATLTMPTAADLSPTMQAIRTLVTVNTDDKPLLTLTFDDNAKGRTLDLRPAAPLVLQY